LKNSYTTDFVKELRQKPTDAEIRLWLKLREMQPAGILFRRQHPLGKYIVDFVCVHANLIIEVDGSQHAEEKNQSYDVKRTAWLENRGSAC
jgi:very-short-patch-repair endonuclease